MAVGYMVSTDTLTSRPPSVLVMQSVMDVALDRVTSSLSPMRNIVKTLEIGDNEYKLSPLFHI